MSNKIRTKSAIYLIVLLVVVFSLPEKTGGVKLGLRNIDKSCGAFSILFSKYEYTPRETNFCMRSTGELKVDRDGGRFYGRS